MKSNRQGKITHYSTNRVGSLPMLVQLLHIAIIVNTTKSYAINI
jgi:hypothetical protein